MVTSQKTFLTESKKCIHFYNFIILRKSYLTLYNMVVQTTHHLTMTAYCTSPPIQRTFFFIILKTEQCELSPGQRNLYATTAINLYENNIHPLMQRADQFTWKVSFNICETFLYMCVCLNSYWIWTPWTTYHYFHCSLYTHFISKVYVIYFPYCKHCPCIDLSALTTLSWNQPLQ